MNGSQKAELVQAIMAGRSLDEAARAVGLLPESVRAAQRADPAFGAELAKALTFAQDPAAVRARQGQLEAKWRARRAEMKLSMPLAVNEQRRKAAHDVLTRRVVAQVAPERLQQAKARLAALRLALSTQETRAASRAAPFTTSPAQRLQAAAATLQRAGVDLGPDVRAAAIWWHRRAEQE